MAWLDEPQDRALILAERKETSAAVTAKDVLVAKMKAEKAASSIEGHSFTGIEVRWCCMHRRETETDDLPEYPKEQPHYVTIAHEFFAPSTFVCHNKVPIIEDRFHIR